METTPKQFALRVLRGECPEIPPWDGATWEKLRQLAEAEGLGPFFHQALASRTDELPEVLRRDFAARHHGAALLDEIRRQELARVARALADAAIPVLVIKGAAVAETLFEEPYFRPRADTDLWISVENESRLDSLFGDLGYKVVPASRGRWIRHQRTFEREIFPGMNCLFDVHWRLSDRILLGERLKLEDCRPRSLPHPVAPEALRMPDLWDSVLIACLHRVGHHPEAEDLVWFWDLHRLCDARTPEWYGILAERARAAEISALVGRCLEQTKAVMGTTVPQPWLESLRGFARTEPSARFLSRHRGRWWGDLWEDLRALPRWTDRLRLLSEHAFPPADFLRHRENSDGPLVTLYLRRLIRTPLRLARRLG